MASGLYTTLEFRRLLVVACLKINLEPRWFMSIKESSKVGHLANVFQKSISLAALPKIPPSVPTDRIFQPQTLLAITAHSIRGFWVVSDQ